MTATASSVIPQQKMPRVKSSQVSQVSQVSQASPVGWREVARNRTVPVASGCWLCGSEVKSSQVPSGSSQVVTVTAVTD